MHHCVSNLSKIVNIVIFSSTITFAHLISLYWAPKIPIHFSMIQFSNSKKSSLTPACHLAGVGYHNLHAHNLEDSVAKFSQAPLQPPSSLIPLVSHGHMMWFLPVIHKLHFNVEKVLFSWNRSLPFPHTILLLAFSIGIMARTTLAFLWALWKWQETHKDLFSYILKLKKQPSNELLLYLHMKQNKTDF